ncbi:hypothetical protein WN943_027164 [Citrus x changshan-huyou]
MDLEGLCATTIKKSRYNKGKSEDNPNKLFFNCPYDVCDFFPLVVPRRLEPSDFDNSAFFEGHRSCAVTQKQVNAQLEEVLSALNEVKTILKNLYQAQNIPA